MKKCFFFLSIFISLVSAQTESTKEIVKINQLELPKLKAKETIIIHLGYSLVYNEPFEQASWVAYELTKEETFKSFERTNKFIPDPKVSLGTANDNDYKGSGFDRGHLAPAGDMGGGGLQKLWRNHFIIVI